MATKIQFRRDTAANWVAVNPVLSEGEMGLDTTNNSFKIGDGVSNWNTLVYSNVPVTDIDGLNDVTITTPAIGEVIKWDGSGWINGPDATAGGTTELNTLADVSISAPVVDHALVYNGSFWSNQALTGTGTVTSIAMTVPTGLTVTGSPITTAGTLAISMAGGYTIPTTTEESNWNLAHGWGDHSLAGYLTAETSHADVLVDGDFATAGFMKTNGAGVYSIDNSTYLTDYTVTQGDVTAHQAALSITESQISDLGTYLTAASSLDVTKLTGTISSANLPAIALTDVYTVADEVSQLALTVQEGDVAVRTDLSKSFIALNATNATMADWQELLTPTDTVTSVNGNTGAVTLTTTDIAEGTNEYYTEAKVSANTSVAANTAKISFDSTASTKVGHISVTQAVNLDTMESDIATNTAKVGYTDGAVDARIAVSYTPINTNAGTSITLALTDANDMVKCTAATAVTVTVPPNSTVAFDIGTEIIVTQYGAGAVTIAPGAAVTINSLDSNLSLAGQYAAGTLKKMDTDEWILIGALIA